MSEQDKELLTTKEAAEYLRMNPYTLAKWRSRRLENFPDIPYIRMGRNIYYRKSDIEAVLEENIVNK